MTPSKTPLPDPPSPPRTPRANTIHHLGGIIAAPGYTDPLVFAAGGNPYGPSVTANGEGPSEQDIAHATYTGKRVATIADKLAG